MRLSYSLHTYAIIMNSYKENRTGELEALATDMNMGEGQDIILISISIMVYIALLSHIQFKLQSYNMQITLTKLKMPSLENWGCGLNIFYG